MQLMKLIITVALREDKALGCVSDKIRVTQVKLGGRPLQIFPKPSSLSIS